MLQLSEIKDCVYSEEFIYKILKLEICNSKIEKNKNIEKIYIRKDEIRIQKFEERTFFPKNSKPHDLGRKKFQEIVKEDKVDIEINQKYAEDIKRLEEKAKLYFNMTKVTNKKQEINLEMNKLAEDNYEKVKGKIISLLSSEEDYQILSKIMFEQAWKDKIFSFLYASLCFEIISKGGANNETRKDHKLRKLIMDECQRTFENRKSKYEPDQSLNLRPDQVEEIIRKKRDQIFGTIRFISLLYEKGIISYFIIMKIIDELLQMDGYANPDENDEIELACLILETCGKKLSESEKQDKFQNTDNKHHLIKNTISEMTFSKALNKLQKIKDSLDDKSRMKYVIMNLIELVENNWIKKKIESPSMNENDKSTSIEYSPTDIDDSFEVNNENNEKNIRNYKKNSSHSTFKYFPKFIQKNQKQDSIIENQNTEDSSFSENSKYESEELKEKMKVVLNSSDHSLKIKDNLNLRNIKDKGNSFENIFSSAIDAWLSNSLQPSNFSEIFEEIIDISYSEKVFSIDEIMNGFNAYLLKSEEAFEECPKLIKIVSNILSIFLIKFEIKPSSLAIITKDPNPDIIINNRLRLAIELFKNLVNTGNMFDDAIMEEISMMKKLILKYPLLFEMTLEEFENLLVEENLGQFV